MVGDPPLVNPWKPGDARVEQAMRDARVHDLRLIYDSSNYVFLARLEHPELGEGLGIYKPSRGERPLYDFPDNLWEREIAAYEFARLLGWDLIPPTVEVTAEHGVGSLQLFIEHDPAEHYFTLRERGEFDWQFVRFAVFDLVANNADRKGGHLLLDPEGHVWGIDNGLCFNRPEVIRTVIWDYAGTTVPEGWIDDLRRVRDQLEGADPVAQPLLERLLPGECDALTARIERLVAQPVLPEMDSYARRVVPWPMV